MSSETMKTNMPMPRQKLLKVALCVMTLYCSTVFLFEHGVNRRRKTRSFLKPRDDWRRGIGGIITNTPPSWKKPTAPYTHEGVLRTQKLFPYEANMLMVFDGRTGEFHTYNDKENILKKSRAQTINFLIAQSLMANFPERFHRGAPTSQVLFSQNDYPTTDVREVDFSSQPDDVDYAPVLQFGSVPRDESLLYPVPIKEMPFVKILGCFVRRAFNIGGTSLGGCFFDENSLPKLLNEPHTQNWDDMISQIWWRGADYNFLDRLGANTVPGHVTFIQKRMVYDNERSVFESLMAVWDNLGPRWKALALSLGADMEARQNGEEVPWIDAKIFLKNSDKDTKFKPFLDAGATIATDKFVTQDEQMNYKYHIDFGGAGGTSWTGMLSKLAMPGVLFHHESMTRDWFYDEVQPWVHYIPVKQDLSDLREKFEWAEAHPAECQAISDAATYFVQKMNSENFMMEAYVKYFVEYLGEAANAYRAGSETLESILEDYKGTGINLEKYSTCDATKCFYPWDGHTSENVQVDAS